MTLNLDESFPKRFSLRVPRIEEGFAREDSKWQNPMFYVAYIEKYVTGPGPMAKMQRQIAGADESPRRPSLPTAFQESPPFAAS